MLVKNEMRDGEQRGWLHTALPKFTPRAASASMLGVFVEGFSPFAQTKSARNWSAQIISTFGRCDGGVPEFEVDALTLFAAIAVPEASAALRRNARLEDVFCSVNECSS